MIGDGGVLVEFVGQILCGLGVAGGDGGNGEGRATVNIADADGDRCLTQHQQKHRGYAASFHVFILRRTGGTVKGCRQGGISNAKSQSRQLRLQEISRTKTYVLYRKILT